MLIMVSRLRIFMIFRHDNAPEGKKSHYADSGGLSDFVKTKPSIDLRSRDKSGT